jgi:hypothetical protein
MCQLRFASSSSPTEIKNMKEFELLDHVVLAAQ